MPILRLCEQNRHIAGGIHFQCLGGISTDNCTLQHATFHKETVPSTGSVEQPQWSYSLMIEYEGLTDIYIQFYADSENIMAWAAESGVLEKVTDPNYRPWG